MCSPELILYNHLDNLWPDLVVTSFVVLSKLIQVALGSGHIIYICMWSSINYKTQYDMELNESKQEKAYVDLQVQ